MLSCIAIDDEPLALELISALCTQHSELDLKRTFTDTREAAKYLRNFPVDLIFLDIQMPDQDGIGFYRQHGQKKMVIFTTAFSEYAIEGFNLDAVDYLLKPIDSTRFEKAVHKACDYHQYLHAPEKKTQRYLFVRSEYTLVKIAPEEIEYIETLDDYLKIHVKDRKTVLTKMNLKNMMERLDANEFVRIHRSYVVPIRKILGYRNRMVQLKEIELPVGARFENDFIKAFKG